MLLRRMEIYNCISQLSLLNDHPAGQYKCQYRDNLIGRSFFSEDGTVIVTGKKTRNETKTTTSAAYMADIHSAIMISLHL